MKNELYLVYGGALKDPHGTDFVNPNSLDLVGIYPDYNDAHLAWKAAAQKTVDNAHMRYFIALLPPLCEGKPA